MHPISHRFQVTAHYLSNFRFRRSRGYLSTTLIRGDHLNPRLRNLAPGSYKLTFLSYYVDIVNRLGVYHECDGLRDRMACSNSMI